MAAGPFSCGDGILYGHAFDFTDSICLYGRLSGSGEIYSAGGDSFYVLCQPWTGEDTFMEKVSGKRKNFPFRSFVGRRCAVSADYGICQRAALLSGGTGFWIKRTADWIE